MAKHRRHNEGSVFKRKRGNRFMWVAKVSLPDGKRQTRYSQTEAEARAKLKEMLTEVERIRKNGIVTAYATMGAFFADWLAHVKRIREAGTHEDHRKMITYYCKEIINIPPAKLMAHHIQKLLERRLDDGLSPNTVYKVYVTIHAALGFAVRQDILDRNVADKVDPPKKKRPQHKTFTAEQVRALWVVIADDRLAALVVLAVSTGLRPGELVGLRWSDVDFKDRAITVQHNIVRVDGKPISKGIKTEAGRRTVDLNLPAYDALIAHKSRQNMEKEILADQWDLGHDLVFASLHGKPINWDWFRKRVFYPALEKAGLPRITPYGMRHTFASLLAKTGAHPKVVQEAMGHGSMNITMDIYTHLFPSMKTEKIHQLGDLLGIPKIEQTLE